MGKEGSNSEVGPKDNSMPDKNSNANIYENRGPRKIIRVITVIAYLFSVSFAGILLSAYYLFLWEPHHPRLIEKERLWLDPQVQFLFALPPLERINLKKQGDFLFVNDLNRTYKPLLDRIVHNIHDDISDVNLNKIDYAKSYQEWLNTKLLKSRHSLVNTLHVWNSNLSHGETSNNSFARMKKIFNSTKKVGDVENMISMYEPRENISKQKILSEIPIIKRMNENVYYKKKFDVRVNFIRELDNTSISNSN